METQIVTDEIKRVVNQIWELTLQLPICETSDSPSTSSGTDDERATIAISGAWNGLLEIAASSELAKIIARKMFDLDASTIPEEAQVIDAFKEISNVIGGNLKTVLPEPCCLSLPEMSLTGTTARDFVDSLPLIELVFRSEQEQLVTRIFKTS